MNPPECVLFTAYKYPKIDIREMREDIEDLSWGDVQAEYREIDEGVVALRV